MFVEFDQMPSHARVWIYISDRQITPGDALSIDGALRSFTAEWAAHGVPLKSSYCMMEDRFVLLAVDEEAHGASGCSIDTSVNALKRVGAETGINFFDRSGVPFLIGGKVVVLRLGELKEKYNSGVWNGQTSTFNIQAGTVGEIREQWTVPAEKSWLKRYMQPLPEDSQAG